MGHKRLQFNGESIGEVLLFSVLPSGSGRSPQRGLSSGSSHGRPATIALAHHLQHERRRSVSRWSDSERPIFGDAHRLDVEALGFSPEQLLDGPAGGKRDLERIRERGTLCVVSSRRHYPSVASRADQVSVTVFGSFAASADGCVRPPGYLTGAQRQHCLTAGWPDWPADRSSHGPVRRHSPCSQSVPRRQHAIMMKPISNSVSAGRQASS